MSEDDYDSSRDIDVVVVAYNSSGDISACLDSLVGIDHLKKVIVVDHGNDGTAQISRDLGATVIENSANPGFGAGQNEGFSAGAAPFVLICNPDATARPEAVRRAVAFLHDAPDVGAVAGGLLDEAKAMPEHNHSAELGPVHLWARSLRLRRLSHYSLVQRVGRRVATVSDYFDRMPSQPIDVQLLSAAMLLIRRQAFEEVGGFDENYFLYGEDLDLCRRLAAGGWRLVALPEIWGTHRAGASSPEHWSHEFEWWRGTMRYEALWARSRQWPIALCAAAVTAVELSIVRPKRMRTVWRSLVFDPQRERHSRLMALSTSRLASPQRSASPSKRTDGEPTRPEISVVIRTHNYAQYLDDALSSVWNQTRSADEVLVVDDGSTDGTEAVLERQQRDGHSFTTEVNAKNVGAPSAFNQGVAASSGELIVVLDADDMLAPNYLEECAKTIEGSRADVVYTRRKFFGSVTGGLEARTISPWLMATQNVVHSSAMFRRSVFDVTGGRPERFIPADYGEDWAMWIGAAETGASFAIASNTWIEIRRHGDNAMTGDLSHRNVMSAYWAIHKLHPETVKLRHIGYRAGLGVWRSVVRLATH
jgi:N-acetylglucosaminyl-diphospho-decaprenol L-rhamnosyltransferase